MHFHQLQYFIKEHAPTYRIENGHYLCHPETCTCDNWKLVQIKRNGSTEYVNSSDNIKFLVGDIGFAVPGFREKLYERWPDFDTEDVY